MADPKQPFNKDDVEKLVDQISTVDHDTYHTSTIDQRFLHDLRQVLATEDIDAQLQQDELSVQRALARIAANSIHTQTDRRAPSRDDRGVVIMNASSAPVRSKSTRSKLTRTFSALAIAAVILAILGSAAFFIERGTLNQQAHQGNTTGVGSMPMKPGTTFRSKRTPNISVSGLQWSPDGKRVYATSNLLESWDSLNGAHQLQYPVHSEGATNLKSQLSPDGKQLAVWEVNKIVILDAQSGKQLNVLTYPFTQPTGPKAYLAHFSTEMNWSEDGKSLRALVENASTTHAYTPVTDVLVTYNVATGKRQDMSIQFPSPVGETAWSPDGKYLAVGYMTGDVAVVNLANEQIMHTWHVGEVRIEYMFLSWSPNSQQLATSYETTTTVWNVATAAKVHAYTDTLALVWSPDGQYLAAVTGKMNATSNDIEVLNASNNQVLYTYHQNSAVGALAWSPDSTYIASSGDYVKVWFARA